MQYIRSRAKEEDHAVGKTFVSLQRPTNCVCQAEQCLHKGMWEADLGPVDDTVPSCFDKSKKVRILRI